MSYHPLGPWTQTDLNNFVFAQAGSFSRVGDNSKWNVISPPSVSSYSGSKYREGVNNGAARIPSHCYTTFSEREMKCIKWEGYSPRSDKPNSRSDMYFLKADIFCPMPALGIEVMTEDSAVNAAFQKIITKQNSTTQVLVNLGEIPETLESLKRLANLLTGAHNDATKSFVKTVSKNKFASVPAVVALVSDLWLEYNFEVAPTISDIHNLYKNIADNLSNKPVETHVKASYKQRDNTNPVFHDGWNDATLPRFDQRTWRTITTVAKLGYTLKAVSAMKGRTLADSLGLGLEDVVPALWELTPYSWLVDYFTNVGDFMNLASFHRGVSEQGYKITVKDEVYYLTATPRGYPSPSIGWLPYITTSGIPGVSKVRRFSFHRDPFNFDTFVPSLKFTMPSLRQAANIAALASSKLLRPKNISSLFPASKARAINEGLRTARELTRVAPGT